jgi:endonuclease IV
MITGFSTGSLALSDFRKALSMLQGKRTNAIELSSLRESEFIILINEMNELDLSQYSYISFHAPSKLDNISEEGLVEKLKKVAEKKWSIIIHPDIIQDFGIWRQLGQYLCIENMDKRKKIGRTAADLEKVFNSLPEASFCFDIAHARQVDPTMIEAFLMIDKFKDRLKQLHISDVNSQSRHEPLNLESILAYKKIAGYIPVNIPIILESPVTIDFIDQELKNVSYIFDEASFQSFLSISVNSTYSGFYSAKAG